MKPKKQNVLIIIIAVIAVLLLASSILMLIGEKMKNKEILSSYAELDNSFGVGPSKIKLTSAEGDFTRGGYMKAEGTDDNNNKIRIYYHWGWCSSGGTDCGFELCLSAPSPENNSHYYAEIDLPEENWLYKLLKENICSRYESGLKESCLSKELEEIKGGRVIFSAILAKADDGSYAFVKGEKQC